MSGTMFMRVEEVAKELDVRLQADSFDERGAEKDRLHHDCGPD